MLRPPLHYPQPVVRQTGDMSSVADSVELAHKYVSGMGDGWVHLSTVGGVAEGLARRSEFDTESVVSAAWLHDVRYAPECGRNRCHPLDGANLLLSVGVPDSVVALVAHHTGAAHEAEERACSTSGELPSPDTAALDVLTMVDLAVEPAGQSQLDVNRIAGMLKRYGEDDPVYRAVTRSRDLLLASSARGKRLLRLPDDWPLVAAQGVEDAESQGGCSSSSSSVLGWTHSTRSLSSLVLGVPLRSLARNARENCWRTSP